MHAHTHTYTQSVQFNALNRFVYIKNASLYLIFCHYISDLKFLYRYNNTFYFWIFGNIFRVIAEISSVHLCHLSVHICLSSVHLCNSSVHICHSSVHLCHSSVNLSVLGVDNINWGIADFLLVKIFGVETIY